jgi:Zn-finger nucleic acid-binding protein
MATPYDERQRFLLCPRCGEILDPTFEGVSACLRCEGMWISPATLEPGFGAPPWSADEMLWWRNSIECPDCVFEGKSSVMQARISSDVIVDRCPQHGLWLDRGELGRLMGVPNDQLAALRARLSGIAPDLERLVARREQWRTDIEIHRKAALEYRQAMEEEQLRRARSSESERLRLEAFARAAVAPTQVLPTLRRASGSDPPATVATQRAPAPRAAAQRQRLGTLAPVAISKEAAQQSELRRHELGTQRTQASDDVSLLQGRLVALEDHVRRLEGQLAEAREHTVSVRTELDTARARLRTLDEQLDGPAWPDATDAP